MTVKANIIECTGEELAGLGRSLSGRKLRITVLDGGDIGRELEHGSKSYSEIMEMVSSNERLSDEEFEGFYDSIMDYRKEQRQRNSIQLT
ncbi:MAG: hypothetical protein ABJA67_14410 [Chthonomonadales bacterium]